MIIQIYLTNGQTTETFNGNNSNNCQVIASYNIEKCGEDIRVSLNTVSQQKEEPSPAQPTTETVDCPFPLEKYSIGCRLKCPTSQFLLDNPTIVCQKIISGRIKKPVDDKCPVGYQKDPAGCVEILTSCPSNFDLIEGSCHEKCPDGSTSQYREVNIENNGIVEKVNTRVCVANPLISS